MSGLLLFRISNKHTCFIDLSNDEELDFDDDDLDEDIKPLELRSGKISFYHLCF